MCLSSPEKQAPSFEMVDTARRFTPAPGTRRKSLMLMVFWRLSMVLHSIDTLLDWKAVTLPEAPAIPVIWCIWWFGRLLQGICLKQCGCLLQFQWGTHRNDWFLMRQKPSTWFICCHRMACLSECLQRFWCLISFLLSSTSLLDIASQSHHWKQIHFACL